jgi:hypothetical protein
MSGFLHIPFQPINPFLLYEKIKASHYIRNVQRV